MKKKPIEVSWTSIDTALWEMREKCRLMQQEGYKDAIEDMFQCGALEDRQPTIASSNKDGINGKD